MKVFENEHFIAADKPSLWLSTPSRLGKDDPRPCLGIWLQDQVGAQIFPIHRLDFEVSGLIFFAKTPEGQKVATKAFEDGKIHKTYQAITENLEKYTVELAVSQKWTSRISKGKKRAYLDVRGKDCLTIATPVTEEAAKICWSLQPRTGRSHQLRFELSHRKFPILGDDLYGAKTPWSPGIALRSVAVEIEKDSPLIALGWPISFEVSDLFSSSKK